MARERTFLSSCQYMMAHGAYPTEKNMLLSAAFLQQELPVRLAHRVTELENLPYGLSTKAPVLKVHPPAHPSLHTRFSPPLTRLPQS